MKLFKKKTEEEKTNVQQKGKRKKLPILILFGMGVFGLAAVIMFSTPMFAESTFRINPFSWGQQWNIYMTANAVQPSGTVSLNTDKSELTFTATNVNFTAFDKFGKLTLPVDFNLVNNGLQDALITFSAKAVDGSDNNTDILESIVITRTGSGVVLYYGRASAESALANIARTAFTINGKTTQNMKMDVTLRLTQGMELDTSNNKIKFTIPFKATQENPELRP